MSFWDVIVKLTYLIKKKEIEGSDKKKEIERSDKKKKLKDLIKKRKLKIIK